jgi:hypothetical protein
MHYPVEVWYERWNWNIKQEAAGASGLPLFVF